MRNRILNCLYREFSTTEEGLVETLREDALILPHNLLPARLSKAAAWLANHPWRVHRHLRKLEKEGFIKRTSGRIALSARGYLRQDLVHTPIGEARAFRLLPLPSH